MIEINKHTTLAKAVHLIDLYKTDTETVTQWLEQLKQHPLPDKWQLNFDDLKFRQLIDLQEKTKAMEDIIFVSLKVLFGLSRKRILASPAFDVVRFALHARDELDRITKLFKAIEYKPSAEEVRAGVHKLNHGFFGTIDWYARRMGYKNHDEVVELNWTVIYQCLKMDHENNQFERRYRDQITKQQRLKR